MPIRAANEATTGSESDRSKKKLKAEMGKTEINIGFYFCFLNFSF